jgi:hypothetical protein
MRQTFLVTLLLLAATTGFALPPENVDRPSKHFILVPQHALQPDDVADLQAKGVTIGRSLGANRYVARVRDLDAIADDGRIRSLEPFNAAHKIAPSAYAQAATSASSAFGLFRVVFHDEVTLDDARQAIEDAGGSDPLPFVPRWRLPNTIAALVPLGALEKLASDDRVFGIYGPPLRPRADNAVAAQLSHVTPLFSAPYNLNGAGVSLSLFELAQADGSHLQFQGKYDTSRVPACTSSTCTTNKVHATHTAGTMISAGLDDPRDSRAPQSKGMAPGADHLYEFNVIDDFANIVSHKDTDLKSLGVSADNNSWDFVLGWSTESGQNVWNGDFFGAYGDPTYQSPYEAITLQSNSPLFVHSAGNDAAQGSPTLSAPFSTHLHCCDNNGNTIKNETFCYSPSGSGNDCAAPCSPGISALTGEAHCETTHHPSIGPYTTVGIEASLKNVVTVGAMDPFSQIAGFSSRGPARDGRIKPELVAKGTNQLSTTASNSAGTPCGSNTGYSICQGTSMSAPVVSGLTALLVQQWRKTFSGQNPLAAVLKTLLIAGADDQVGPASLDLPGPDYIYGFGLADAQKSVDLIIADGGTGSHIKTGTLHNGDTVEFPLSVTSPQNIRVVLGWFDPDIVTTPDTPIDVPALLNDLDLKVIDPSGNTVLPYVLDKNNPSAPATQGVNHVDTTEMVEIKPGGVGQYRVIVSAKLGDTVKHPTQDFALVSSAPLTNAAPACGDNFEPNDVQGSAFKYLASGQTISARTCSAQDLDFYDINMQKGGTLSVTVTATDTPLHVTLSGNGLAATSVDVPAGGTRSVSGNGPAGIYDVEVQPNGAVGATSTYTLTATFPVPATTVRRRPARH